MKFVAVWLVLIFFLLFVFTIGPQVQLPTEDKLLLEAVLAICALLIIGLSWNLANDQDRDAMPIIRQRQMEQNANVYIVMPPAPTEMHVHHTHSGVVRYVHEGTVTHTHSHVHQHQHAVELVQREPAQRPQSGQDDYPDLTGQDYPRISHGASYGAQWRRRNSVPLLESNYDVDDSDD